MVRKRSRRYSSENESDSDVDFEVGPRSGPAPKKYSLRERKSAPLFTTDFDYYGLDDDEGEGQKSSDDDDFEVEEEPKITRPYFEPQADADRSNSDGKFLFSVLTLFQIFLIKGLIDFEDVIRADVVMNQRKIDYDNLIEKSEIPLTTPKRRGRRPKYQETKKETNLEDTANLDALTHLENTDSDLKNAQNEVIQEKSFLPPEIKYCQAPEFPNGDLMDEIEKNESETDPLVLKNAKCIETIIVPPPDLKEEKKPEDDDDVIVLGELKHPVIVLDD